jgi:hypothetical protein
VTRPALCVLCWRAPCECVAMTAPQRTKLTEEERDSLTRAVLYLRNAGMLMTANDVRAIIDRLTAPQDPALTPDPEVAKFADDAVLWLCELPDRTSPEDWPEACLVTGEELHAYLTDNIPALLSKASPQGPVAQGWKLVPRKPTLEMIKRAHEVPGGIGGFERMYQAMYDAAPPQDPSPQLEEKQ